MELEDCRLYKAIDEASPHEVSNLVLELIEPGRKVTMKDKQGKTLLHHVCLRSTKFRELAAVPVVCQLGAAGCDVNEQDDQGNTCLHLAMQHGDAGPLVAALFRIGVDCKIRNSEGMRAEDLLLQLKPEGWQNTHKGYCRFYPGLYHAIHGKQGRYQTVLKLLRSWCKTKIYRRGEVVDLKRCAIEDGRDDRIPELFTKYEKQNEFVHAVLAGNCKMIETLRKQADVKVNSLDMSCHNKNSPYPQMSQFLMGDAFLQANLKLTSTMMSLNPDIRALCRQNGTNVVKPILFHMVSSKVGIEKPSILKHILTCADLQMKDTRGRTVLFEAIQAGHSDQLITYLLNIGKVDIATRDCHGKTARDHAEKLNRVDCIQAIDDYIIRVLKSRDIDCARNWVMKGYDHILDILKSNSKSALDLKERLDNSRLMKEIKQFIEDIPKLEVTIDYILKAHDLGDLEKVSRLVQLEDSVVLCQDYCGKSILHRSVLSGNVQDVIYLINMEPKLLHVQDNMLRTVLHYAYCLYGEGEMVQCLLEGGASQSILDVHLRKPNDLLEDNLSVADYRETLDEIQQFTAHVKLMQIDFEASLRNTIKTSALVEEVDILLSKAGRELDITNYSHVLFDCVDYGREDVAEYLIMRGCNPHIWRKPKTKKRVSIKSADSTSLSRGSTLEYVSLYQRAIEEEMENLAALIANTVDNVRASKTVGNDDSTKQSDVVYS